MLLYSVKFTHSDIWVVEPIYASVYYIIREAKGDKSEKQQKVEQYMACANSNYARISDSDSEINNWQQNMFKNLQN